jgi:hypothetical protein
LCSKKIGKHVALCDGISFERFFSLLSEDMMSEQAKTSEEGRMPSENEQKTDPIAYERLSVRIKFLAA